MKKTNWLMRILLTLPMILLVILLVWMMGDKAKGEKKNVETESSMEQVTEEADVGLLDTEGQVMADVSDGTSSHEEDTTKAAPQDLTLLFAGDVLLSNHVLQAYDKAGGIEGVLDESILQEVNQADIFMVNEEFPFSDRGKQAPDKQFTFRLPPSRVSMMNEMGIDIVTLANNHALDYGTDALVDTCAVLDEAGIKRVGAGADLEEAKKPEFIEANGRTIGFLGASRVIPVHTWTAGKNTPGMLTTYDPAILLEQIKKTKEQCDYLVVYVHWGVEKEQTPKDYQRTLGKQYIDAGADLVVGSHPHVLQGIEYYNGKPIIYSLGNFVFGSSIPKTALLKVSLTDNEAHLSLIPCTSSKGYTQTVKGEEEIRKFYKDMTSLSFDVSVDENGIVTSIP